MYCVCQKCDTQLKNSPPSSSLPFCSVSQNCHSGGYPFQFPGDGLGSSFRSARLVWVKSQVIVPMEKNGDIFFRTFLLFFLGCSFRIDVSMFHSYSIWWFLNDCNSWDGLKHVEITNRRSILWLRSVKFSVEPVGYHPVGPIGCAQATSPEFWS